MRYASRKLSSVKITELARAHGLKPDGAKVSGVSATVRLQIETVSGDEHGPFVNMQLACECPDDVTIEVAEQHLLTAAHEFLTRLCAESPASLWRKRAEGLASMIPVEC